MERRHDWMILASVRGERERPYSESKAQSEQRSLFAHAMHRAQRVVPLSRLTPVVLDEHRPWWSALLSDVPHQNLVIEPFDRGTAPGILLAASRILRLDPKANVAILGMDREHGIDDLDAAYRCALDLAQTNDSCAGVTRAGAVERLAWSPTREVEMVVGSIQHVMTLFHAAQPKLLQTFQMELRGPALFAADALDALYPFLPEVAFTEGVLAPTLTGVRTALAEPVSAAVS